MTQKQIDLLMKRLVKEPQKYWGVEPATLKEKRDLVFCRQFFGQDKVDGVMVEQLLNASISSQSEQELDLILMLLTHFQITKEYDLILAPLLVEPWHHCHDRIASILEFDINEEITDYLYLGALYTCDHLVYESDYCGFNRKCLYALAKIGTQEAIDYIKKVSVCENQIISNHARNVIRQFHFE